MPSVSKLVTNGPRQGVTQDESIPRGGLAGDSGPVHAVKTGTAGPRRHRILPKGVLLTRQLPLLAKAVTTFARYGRLKIGTLPVRQYHPNPPRVRGGSGGVRLSPVWANRSTTVPPKRGHVLASCHVKFTSVAFPCSTPRGVCVLKGGVQ
jgi:hypothetical protein